MSVPSTFAARQAASFLVLLSGAAAAVAAVAAVDTVPLRNGDRLTGRILHQSADALAHETRRGGKIRPDQPGIPVWTREPPAGKRANDSSGLPGLGHEW